MNIIKLLFGCRFIGNIYDVAVVVDSQNKLLCVVHNSLVEGLFSA